MCEAVVRTGSPKRKHKPSDRTLISEPDKRARQRTPRINPPGGTTTTTTMDLYCMDKKLSELGEHDFDELLDTGVFAPASQTVSYSQYVHARFHL